MESVVEGVQLPVDGAGKITGAFILQGAADTEPDASTGALTIVIPATALVDHRGGELGTRLLDQLESIASMLERIEPLLTLATAAITE